MKTIFGDTTPRWHLKLPTWLRKSFARGFSVRATLTESDLEVVAELTSHPRFKEFAALFVRTGPELAEVARKTIGESLLQSHLRSAEAMFSNVAAPPS
jgi:hypothetical protein